METGNIIKKDLRVICEDSNYYVTEVGYNEKGEPISFLGPECGILSYWGSRKELKESLRQAEVALRRPIIYK